LICFDVSFVSSLSCRRLFVMVAVVVVDIVSCESRGVFLNSLSILVVCNNTLIRLCVAIGGHGHGYVNFYVK